MARENSHRVTVVGLGAKAWIEVAESFVTDTGTSFAMVWSESAEPWRHFGVLDSSSFVLLDSRGIPVGDGPSPYDRALVDQLLDRL